MLDEDIIRLFCERNEDAVSETKKKYGGYCFSVAENITGNPEDAEECLNLALLNLWNAIPPEKPKNLKIFAARITRNIALNMLNENNAEKRGGGKTESVFDELCECIQEKEDTESRFFAEELNKSINVFISKLPEKERNIFIRRYFFGESFSEIAKRYSVSENSAAVILHRTRKKLKKHLEKEGYFR